MIDCSTIVYVYYITLSDRLDECWLLYGFYYYTHSYTVGEEDTKQGQASTTTAPSGIVTSAGTGDQDTATAGSVKITNSNKMSFLKALLKKGRQRNI